MVVLTRVLTSLSSHCAELPVSGYKNVGMHILVPSSSAEPLNVMSCGLPRRAMPDSAWRRGLNCSTAGLSPCSVDLLSRGLPPPVYAEWDACPKPYITRRPHFLFPLKQGSLRAAGIVNISLTFLSHISDSTEIKAD
jgi:hypothetical protein